MNKTEAPTRCEACRLKETPETRHKVGEMKDSLRIEAGANKGDEKSLNEEAPETESTCDKTKESLMSEVDLSAVDEALIMNEAKARA